MEHDTTGANTGVNRDENDTESRPISGRTHVAAEQVRNAALDRINAAQESVDTIKVRAAQRVKEWSATVRKVGEHLRVEDQVYVADRAERASKKLDEVASYVRSAELGTLLRDAEDLARRQPLAFFGGALVVGIATGRFLKGAGSTARPQGTAHPARDDRPVTDEIAYEDTAPGGRVVEARSASAGYAGNAQRAPAPSGSRGGDGPRANRRNDSERGARR